MVLWLHITTDEYELPLAVADTRKELAILCGVKPESISETISMYRKRKMKCPYIKIKIEEDTHESN